MPSPLLARRDIEFLLYEWLDVEALTVRERFAAHSRDTFDPVLELSQRIAVEHFAPHNARSDREEPRFDGTSVVMIPEVGEALAVFAASGLLGASMDESVGGLQLPNVVTAACFAWFHAANVATFAYPFLTAANANLLLAHGTPEQIDTFVKPMVEGRFFGTMCLSEPQAGSSLADIATKAVPESDGTYRLFGNKMWISGGDHEMAENIIHLVLARIPGGPPGVQGLSLFIVPRLLVGTDGEIGERNDVVLAGVNHKMGFRGTVNTLLNFGEGRHQPGGAVGYLVGEANRGMSAMFHMMNEARAGVGMMATALGYTAYLKALDYAKDRPQGRAVGAKDPTSAPVPIIAHADVRRMLLAQKSYVEGALALNLYVARLLDEELSAETPDERARAHLLLEILTPIAKSWPSQWCLAANDLAIQVHGGYGYSREYEVEQHYRDNRLNSIHEGTHGIQALDLLGRKVTMADGRAFEALVETMRTTVGRAESRGPDLTPMAEALDRCLDRLEAITQQVVVHPDSTVALANSSLYLEATGHVVLAWIWLEQALVAATEVGDFYDGKRHAAQYFFRYELPRTSAQFDLLGSLDSTTTEMKASWF